MFWRLLRHPCTDIVMGLVMLLLLAAHVAAR